MKVCDFYSKVLHEYGVECVFGVPGSFIMPIWQSISKNIGIKLTRHENGAVFMADGYSRGSGKLGIAITTVGPGVTNSITGIACAYQDSIPLLMLAGNGPVSGIRKGGFQNCDVRDRGFYSHDLLQKITKQCFFPQTAQEAIRDLFEAIRLTNEGRKGPVHLSLPLDVQNFEISDNMIPSNNFQLLSTRKAIFSERIIEEIVKKRRIIFLCGWGTFLSDAGEILSQVSIKTNIPIVSTLKGVSACTTNNPLFWGVIGNVMHKGVRQRLKEYQADLIIALGTSLSENSCPDFEDIFGKPQIIQVDIEKSKFDRYRHCEFHVESSIKEFLNYLYSKTDLICKEKIVPIIVEEMGSDVNYFAKIVNKMNAMLPENSVVIPDAGNHWLDVLYWYRTKNIKGLMTNAGLASMGHAIGAAIGMSCAMPEKIVVCVTGDGSFLMSGSEINVAVNYGIKVIYIVANNHSLGRVRCGQINMDGGIVSSSIENVSIELCAKGLGADAYSCTSLDQFVEALEKSIRSNNTSVIEVIIDDDDCPVILQTSR